MSQHITATPVPWHAEPDYVGKRRDDTEAALRRDWRAFSRGLVYGRHHVARHYAEYVR